MDTDTMDGGVVACAEPATEIIEAVGRAKGVDPLELDPLYEEVDPGAINDLITRSGETVRVEFEYEGYTVLVRGDGRIQVE